MPADPSAAAIVPIVPPGSIADTIRSFTDAAGSFFDSLSTVRFGYLLLALLCFGVYLGLRSRAIFNALRAAYPDVSFQWRRVWGAYVAAYGINGIVPAGGGGVVQLMLTKISIPGSSYPTVLVGLCVAVIFDAVMAVLVLGYAFTQGAFPRPADFVNLNSFDISFLASHLGLTLFAFTLLAVIALAFYGWASLRFERWGEHLRQGLAILSDRRRYLLGMCVPQAIAYCFRVATYWLMLEAFNIHASLRNTLLVLAAVITAAVVPFTPGGAGVVQALILVVFAGAASQSTVAAFSVGEQIAIVGFTLTLGFLAVALIFKYRSLPAALRDARARRRAETKGLAA